jgi:N6-adenosine-specific RNA methylase IME4
MTRPGTAITRTARLPYKLRETAGRQRRNQGAGVPATYSKGNATRLVLPGNIKATGWQLPSHLSEAQWMQAGIVLGGLERTMLWLIGDWWRFGNKTYGSRKSLVARRDWKGPSYQTCRNAASVAEKFELSRRRDNLSFAHHAEVAALHPEEADHWLNWCEKTTSTEGKLRSVRELRAQMQRRRPVVGSATSTATCTVEDLATLVSDCLKFGCIYADPPWPYCNQATRSATLLHYGSMTLKQLLALPISELAANDSHLHLWTTNSFLPEAIKLLEGWGFEYRSNFVWVKPGMGIGNYWRCTHEILLTGIRGKAKRFQDASLRSWGQYARCEHSQKPDEVYSMIERASPGPRLELFARSPREGWAAWGDQITRAQFGRSRTAR